MAAGAMLGISALMGAGQTITGLIKNRKAKESFPDLVDANELNFANELDRKATSYFTGSQSAAGMSKLSDASAAITKGITDSSSGDSAAALTAFGNQQASLSEGFNNILADAEARAFALTQARMGMKSKIADRKMQLQLAKYSQGKAEGASLINSGLQNIMSATTGLLENKKTELDEELSPASSLGSAVGGLIGIV